MPRACGLPSLRLCVQGPPLKRARLSAPPPPTRRRIAPAFGVLAHRYASSAPEPVPPPPVAPSAPPKPSWIRSFPRSWQPYMELARLDKPAGTWMLYWPCAWSISMAAHHSALPPTAWAYQIALFGVGAIIMRGAGCTINDLWDRDIDDKVGTVTPFQAVAFLGLELSAGLAVLTQLNLYSIALGAASLSIVVVYPLMKRITDVPQFVLGLAFNYGALLGSSAVLGYCDWAVALPLYVGSIAWTLVYDTIYAHQDKVDDRLVGVRSTALLFGDEGSKPAMTVFSSIFVTCLAYAGYANAQGPLFYSISVLGAAAHLAWQIRTVELNKPASCWQRFASNRDLGYIVFAGLSLDYLALVAFA